MSLDDLCSRIGYRFRQPDLLRQALTHRSHSTPHNERLEFLGDGMLNCLVAHLLFQRFAALPEGELSRLRAALVRQEALHRIALDLGIGDLLRLGEGELRSGGNRRPSILADAVEALFGAVFLDGGFDAVAQVVDGLYRALLEEIDPLTHGKDPKTMLQEYLQGRRLPLPRYSIVATRGVAHEQTFEVECAIPDLDIRCQGEGPSRRSAEQEAARRAYREATES